MQARFLVALAIALTLTSVVDLASAQAPQKVGKMYKWVDKDGNVHFSDQVPPEAVGYKREAFNNEGVAVETVDRAMTAEEQAAKDAAEKAAAEAAKKEEMERKADETLLNSYASEADLTRSYNQRMDLLEQTIEARRVEIGARDQSLTSLVTQAATLERSGKPVSDTLKQMIASERSEIDKQREYLKKKDAEKGQALIEYQHDLARYKAALARNVERAKKTQ